MMPCLGAVVGCTYMHVPTTLCHATVWGMSAVKGAFTPYTS